MYVKSRSKCSSTCRTLFLSYEKTKTIIIAFISRVLLKQATKKKNERLITQCFGVLITPLSSEIGIIHYYSQANARDEKN